MRRPAPELFIFTMLLIFTVSVPAIANAHALQRAVGLFDGNESTRLGTLFLIHDRVGLYHYIQGYFANLTTRAKELDLRDRWDFRWIAITLSNGDGAGYSSEGYKLDFPYIAPPSGGFHGGPDDEEPFFWHTELEFEANHLEGVDSYFGLLNRQLIGDQEKEIYLVLHNPADPKTILLLDHGSFGIIVGPVLYDGPYPLEYDPENPEYPNNAFNAAWIEVALENSGFFGYTVIPTCETCGFSFDQSIGRHEKRRLKEPTASGLFPPKTLGLRPKPHEGAHFYYMRRRPTAAPGPPRPGYSSGARWQGASFPHGFKSDLRHYPSGFFVSGLISSSIMDFALGD